MSDDYWEDPDDMREEYQRMVKSVAETATKVGDAEKYVAFLWMRLTHTLIRDHGYCRVHANRWTTIGGRKKCGDCTPVTPQNEDVIASLCIMQEYTWYLLQTLGIRAQTAEVKLND